MVFSHMTSKSQPNIGATSQTSVAAKALKSNKRKKDSLSEVWSLWFMFGTVFNSHLPFNRIKWFLTREGKPLELSNH